MSYRGKEKKLSDNAENNTAVASVGINNKIFVERHSAIASEPLVEQVS